MRIKSSLTLKFQSRCNSAQPHLLQFHRSIFLSVIDNIVFGNLKKKSSFLPIGNFFIYNNFRGIARSQHWIDSICRLILLNIDSPLLITISRTLRQLVGIKTQLIAKKKGKKKKKIDTIRIKSRNETGQVKRRGDRARQGEIKRRGNGLVNRTPETGKFSPTRPLPRQG